MINFIIGLAKPHRTSGNTGEMCKNINFRRHKAQRQLRKLYANVKLLLRKFSKCSVGVKCLLFKTYCSNLYCAHMLFDCAKAALKKLIIAHKNSLRRFMFLPWRNSATEMGFFCCKSWNSFFS